MMNKKILLFLLFFSFIINVYADEEYKRIDESTYYENKDIGLKLYIDNEFNLHVDVLSINNDVSCDFHVLFSENGEVTNQLAGYGTRITKNDKSLVLNRLNEINPNINYYKILFGCRTDEDVNKPKDLKSNFKYLIYSGKYIIGIFILAMVGMISFGIHLYKKF